MTVTWFEGIPITVEAGLSAATGTYGVWDTSLWDTGTWGPDTVWTDISQWVRSIETRRRFERDLQAWSAGEATVVLDNSDGRFSPANLSGPYVIGGVTGIRPWRPIRIKVAGTPIYTGYALAWNEVYARGHGTASVVVPCRDEFASLARIDGFETAPQGAGESSGLRMHRVLNNAGHTGDRAIDVGRVAVQATTLAQNTVAELKLTADSEGGAVWVEADGSVWFENRYALLENSRSNTVQATFGDGSGGVTELACSDVEVSYDEDRLVNFVSFARAGGTAHLVGDATSRALYGDKTYQRHDLIAVAEAPVAALAELYVAAHKDAELRVRSITFSARRKGPYEQPFLLEQALTRRVRDLVRVVVRPAGGHTITRDCFISGIAHSITPQGEWTVKFDLESAEPWVSFTGSLWDTATWDSATWFY